MNDNRGNLLEEIRQRLETLNKSERKVATVIMRDPNSAIRLTITALAQEAGVSEPTVNRFCRGFDERGYPDFKLRLAQSLAGGMPYVTRNVEFDDSTEEYTDKIFSSTIAAIDSARKTLRPPVITRAVDYLSQAKQIFFFGMGASGPVALDAQHKFFRLNIPVMAYEDALMQRMVAAGAHTGDVIVIISYTGRTRELVEIAGIGRESGATVIGITTEHSPLAKECTLLLSVPSQEDTDIYMPMTSRLIQLTMLDVLATGVTLRRGVDFQRYLKRIKDSLAPTRFANE
ncbi:MurR/RpiR family transcriptional regulator [Nitrincola alkalilacustris]|uniref:MurR/RpiR family transcriptional regulator n=1 Tax=Nitrincola alkalilacustris TaxID=1571224 RepID=UPI00124F546D|nr:MurR/RpiR family transcriptional regulator [Nitrincola alkalilacustris]